MYATSQDDSVIVWDLLTQHVKSKLKGHTNRVRDLDFYPKDTQRRLVSVGFDKAIRIWGYQEEENK